MDLLDQVRASCRQVAAGAELVRIDEGVIADYAGSLPLADLPSAELDPRYHYRGEPEATLAFVLTLDAINFGSGYFPELRKRPGLSGYFTVAASLTDEFRARGPLAPAELATMTIDDCRRIFDQVPDDGAIDELMGLFARALNDLGRYVLVRFGGQFAALVEAAEHSAERLVRILVEMPYFRDVALYRDDEVAFYKRAQITAADLALVFGHNGLGRFDDLERLTIFADNLVPHVLRVDGVLRYDPALAERIDSGQRLEAQSSPEVEIRASAVHAAELIAAQLRATGQRVTAMQLDYLLWNRGQQPRYKAHPRHRARTVFY